MKNLLIVGLSLLTLAGVAHATSPYIFTSGQVGASPVNGYYLQTDGTNSTWAAVSGGVGTGLATTSPVSDSNLLVYKASGAGSAYGVATSTVTLGLGLTGTTVGVGSSNTLSVATSSLYTGTANQFPYFSGTNILSATSSISSAFIEDKYLRNDGNDTTSGQLTATNFVANSSSATSTFAGGFAVKTSKFVVDNSTGNVGIGTASPSALFSIGSSNSFLVANSGKTGILTSVPSSASLAIGRTSNGGPALLMLTTGGGNSSLFGLDGSGNAEWWLYDSSSNVTAKFFGGGSPSYINTGQNFGIGDITPAALLTVGNGDLFQVNSSGAIAASTGITTSGSYTQSGTSANTFTGTATFSNATYSALFTGGNVGIGAATPSTKLEVSSTVTGASATDGTALRISGLFNGSWTGDSEAAKLEFYNNDASSGGAGVRGNIRSISENSSGNNWALTFGTSALNATPTEKVRITSSGNVGIGDTSPTALLTVGSGDLFQVNSSGAIAAVTGITSSGTLHLTSASDSYFTGGGKLGIGTASPGYALDVDSGTTAQVANFTADSGTVTVRYNNSHAYSTSNAVSFQARLNTDSTNRPATSIVSSFTDVADATRTSQVQIQTIENGGSLTAAMTFKGTKVGIATSSPAYKLDVYGGLRIDPNTGELVIPFSANPTVSTKGDLAINTTAASSSLRFHDGTAERALYDTIEKSFTIASSTWLADAGATASSTIPLGVASSHGETWLDGTCYTDSGGTAQVEFGDGTNWMDYQSLTTTAATQTYSSNNTFTDHEKRFVRVGQTATNPDYITCSERIRVNAD